MSDRIEELAYKCHILRYEGQSIAYVKILDALRELAAAKDAEIAELKSELTSTRARLAELEGIAEGLAIAAEPHTETYLLLQEYYKWTQNK